MTRSEGDDGVGALINRQHGVVPVAYHQFLFVDGDWPPPVRSVPTNGLVLACTDAVVLWTGIHTGVVDLAVEIAAQPPALDLAPWDEVVEVNLTAPTGRLRPVALMADIMPAFPALTPLAGELRVRVHARGRDTDIDGTACEPFEQYLIQAWPAEPGPEQVHKQTDRYGAQVRASARDSVPWEPSPEEEAEAAHRAEIDAYLIRKHAELFGEGSS